jgi:hypothetical protein
MRNLRRILSIAMALLLLFSLGLAASAEKSGELEILGEELFTESNALTPVICADGGIPYVAFIDFANEGKLTVMKYEEEEWRVVGNAAPTGYMLVQPGFPPGRLIILLLISMTEYRMLHLLTATIRLS